jgi:RimJ/RimL family protein N-acetyltransferase
MLANHQRNVPGILVHLCLSVITSHTQDVLGWCGPYHFDPAKANPVLFHLQRGDRRRQGLTTEAANAVLDYAFAALGLARVNGAAALDNITPWRVLEKIGVVYQGLDQEGAHSFKLAPDGYNQQKQPGRR